jgi:hypothetical protein
VKYCRECKYYNADDPDKQVFVEVRDIAYCSAPQIGRVAILVYGPFEDGRDGKGAMMSIGHVRMFGCGEDGNWWEAKE